MSSPTGAASRPPASAPAPERLSRDDDLALHALRGVAGYRALEVVGALLEGHGAAGVLAALRLQLQIRTDDLEAVVDRTLVLHRDRERAGRGLDRVDVEGHVVRVDRDRAVDGLLGGLRVAPATAARGQAEDGDHRENYEHRPARHRREASQPIASDAGSKRFTGREQTARDAVTARAPRIPSVSCSHMSTDPHDEVKHSIRMTADRLLLAPSSEAGDRKSRAGILIPATANVDRRLVWAEVVAAGPTVRTIEVADRVLFSPDTGFEVEIRGEDYLILRERDVHAIASTRAEGQSGLYL